MDTEHDWTLLPAVVVRSAGFPWELVLSLVHPRAAETAAAVVRLERQALDLLTEAPGRDPTPARPAHPTGGRAGNASAAVACRAACAAACAASARCPTAPQGPKTG
ncbi:unnamed protein product [[Actinomadura] parvosata subsp. kistnae]|uniref:hypothetical protein n=1 Tax=[Actinomadura] parvosata TaxID=1955412 RepID=UPI000D2E6646|nr:unnamed protein product [Actinomadura parvosata subsp. kistnae]